MKIANLILIALACASAPSLSDELNVYNFKSVEPVKSGWYAPVGVDDKGKIEVELENAKGQIASFDYQGYASAHLDKIDDNFVITLHFKNQEVPKEIFFAKGAELYKPNITSQEFKGKKQTIVQFMDTDVKKLSKLFIALLELNSAKDA